MDVENLRYKYIDDVKSIVKSQNHFAKELYLILAKATDENLFFSPLSITTAFAMVYMSTGGNTKSQMESAMRYPTDRSSVQKGYRDLIADFKKGSHEYELHTSNLVYFSHEFKVLKEYAETLSQDFHSSAAMVDFSESDIVRRMINEATEKDTRSKIKEILPEGVINELTRMVLVSAIYFKGVWEHQFERQDTKPLPFWLTAKEFVNIPMMTVKEGFRIAKINHLDATLLSQDYKGNRFSLKILLPNGRDGLGELEKKLNSVDLSMLDDANTSVATVKVTIPKFKLEISTDLIPLLTSMGMTDLFSEDLCYLPHLHDGGKGISVSNVFHKAFLEVNEEGSEAAAATAVGFSLMCFRPPPPPGPPFLADHPFFFYIMDSISGAVLFAGRFLKLPSD